MTLTKLASLIAKREGKKHQASIGDVREILNIICTLEAEEAVKLPFGKSTIFELLEAHSVKIQKQIEYVRDHKTLTKAKRK